MHPPFSPRFLFPCVFSSQPSWEQKSWPFAQGLPMPKQLLQMSRALLWVPLDSRVGSQQVPSTQGFTSLPVSAGQAQLSTTDTQNPLLQPQLPLEHEQPTHDGHIYSLTRGQHIPDSGHAQITAHLLRSRHTNTSLKCKVSEHGNSSPCHMISTEIAGEWKKDKFQLISEGNNFKQSNLYLHFISLMWWKKGLLWGRDDSKIFEGSFQRLFNWLSRASLRYKKQPRVIFFFFHLLRLPSPFGLLRNTFPTQHFALTGTSQECRDMQINLQAKKYPDFEPRNSRLVHLKYS